MCSTVRRGGWANTGESPGLSCYCTLTPREIHTFLSAQTFLSGASLRVTVTSEDLEQKRARAEKKKVGPLLSAFLLLHLPPLFLLSFPQHIAGGGGGWVCTVLELVIWLESSEQHSMCSPTLLHCYYLCKRLYTL